jgi:hypothetical protein
LFQFVEYIFKQQSSALHCNFGLFGLTFSCNVHQNHSVRPQHAFVMMQPKTKVNNGCTLVHPASHIKNA